MRLIVALTGASGAVFGIRLLEYLHARQDVEIHLIVSHWAEVTLSELPGWDLPSVKALADYVYDENNLAAPVASGSFPCDAMMVVPCSMKTLAAAAAGLSDSLITRAIDVSIKERRPLVMAVRETPLSPIHLENMLKLSRIGVTIMPPVPAFYGMQSTIEEVVDSFLGRALMQIGIDNDLCRPWQGEVR